MRPMGGLSSRGGEGDGCRDLTCMGVQTIEANVNTANTT